MLSVAKLGFVYTIAKAYVGKCIDLYREGLLSLYEYEIYKGEEYKKAEDYIEETLLQSEINNFIKILVEKDTDFSHITNNLLKSFDIVSVLDQLHCKVSVFLHAIDELLSIFITLRFDQTGNIRTNIPFKQVAKITECIVSKMEHNCFHTPLHDISTVVRYLEIAKEKADLPSGVIKSITELNVSPNKINKFTITDVVTADIFLDVIFSGENHIKKLDYYKKLREIITEVLSLSSNHRKIEDFFIKLSRDNLVKLIHYKDSFLKLLKSDKCFSLKQVSNIILQLVDPHILDLTLSTNARNDSLQEIENFIIEVNKILSNSPANVYSQTEIDDFIKEAQAKRCLKIHSIYYHSHPIFYHLLNRLIRINTLSLKQIRKFIEIIACDTTNIVNNNMFTGREFLFNDFRNIILNQKRANFGADYIIHYLLDNNTPIEEIGKLFSGLLKLRGYCGLYQLLYEEYHLLNTSVQIYCYIKDHVSLNVEEFSSSFIKQFINEIEEFDSEFWQREYIPGILKMLPATLQNASSEVIIKMLMTLKSELQNCSSYRDIIKRVFTAEQNSSKFWLQINELMKSFTLSKQSLLIIEHDIRLNSDQEHSEYIDDYTSYLAKIVIESSLHIAAQQILNDKCNPEIKTLFELSMNQLINNIALSALTKAVGEQQPSSSLCGVRLHVKNAPGNATKQM